jgi:hypothetical protein
MMEIVRRIFWPAKVEPAQAEPKKAGPIATRRIIVRSNLSESERAELRRWAKRQGIAKYQNEPDGSELEATAAKTLRGMEQTTGKWGK